MQFITLLYPFTTAKKPLKSIKNYLILLVFICMAFSCRTNSTDKDAVALAVIGDRYHNSDYIRTELGKTLVRDAGIAIDFTDDIKQLSRDNLDKYRLLIMFRDGMVWPDGYGEGFRYIGFDTRDTSRNSIEISPSSWTPGYSKINPLPIVSNPPLEETHEEMKYWMTGDQARAINEFIEGGGSALFYHNCNYISKENEIFKGIIGAITEGHPPIRPFLVING